MFNTNLILDDASGDDITFNLVSQDGTGTRRVDIASAHPNLRVLNIKHSTSGNAASGITDRHLVQLVETKELAAGGSVDITVNFTINVPRFSDVTPAMVLDDVAIVLDLITDGALVNPMTAVNLNALLRGES